MVRDELRRPPKTLGTPDMGAQASSPAESNEEQERCIVRNELRRPAKPLGARASSPAESNEEQERCMLRNELRRPAKPLGTRASRPHF